MDLVEHYTGSHEQIRLSHTPHGRLEFLRTQELIRRFVTVPGKVLDVGGGTGCTPSGSRPTGMRCTRRRRPGVERQECRPSEHFPEG